MSSSESYSPGQTILIKPTALLFKSSSVRMHLHFEYPSGTWQTWRSWGSRYMWLRLQGALPLHYRPSDSDRTNPSTSATSIWQKLSEWFIATRMSCD